MVWFELSHPKSSLAYNMCVVYPAPVSICDKVPGIDAYGPTHPFYRTFMNNLLNFLKSICSISSYLVISKALFKIFFQLNQDISQCNK